MSTSVLPDIHQRDGLDRQRTSPPAAWPIPHTRSRPRRDAYVLGERLFRDALVRERKRADRLATSFAVLVVDRSDRPAAEGSAWVAIIRALSAVKRNVDAMGWLEQGAVLGLILPDASRRGGLKVMRHLRRQVARRLGDDALAALSMRLYTQGGDAEAGGVPCPPVDLLLDAFISQRHHPLRDATKRALDIVGGIALLVLFAPLMLALFAIVKSTSRGAAFYRQPRIGRRGEPFTMLKFRTMHVDAGSAIHNDYVTWFITSSDKEPRKGDEVFKLTDDPRITRPGRFLRRTSLDELPQFLNVIRGEMSLVGPRPPLAYEVEKYQPWHRRRVLEAKPGVTGLWQVKGRSRTTFDEMVRMDLEYARSHSLWTDIKILAATPAAMVKGAS